MIIFLDSTAVVRDFLVSGSDFRMLSDYLSHTDARLFVHRITVEEAVSNHYRSLKSALADLRKAHRSLPRLLGSRSPLAPDIDVDSESAWYRGHLTSRLSQLDAALVDYPTISHESLAVRAARHERPFDEEGSGYRDSIIWMSLVSVLSTDTGPLVFVSDDKKAFVAPDKVSLHPDLVQELSEAGVPAESIRFYRGLRSFIDAVVKPTLEEIEAVRSSLDNNTYAPLDLMNWFEENSQKVTQALQADLEMPREAETVEISYLGHPQDLSVKTVLRGTGGELYIEFDVDYSFTVDFFVDKHDYYIESDANPGWEIMDGDWNETYVWVNETKFVTASFRLDFLVSDQVVTGIELLEMKEVG